MQITTNNNNISNVELSSKFDTTEMLYQENSNQNFDAFTLNFVPKITNQLSINLNSFLYNRIEGKISELVEPLTGAKIYLIPTDDGTNGLLICEMNSKMKNELVDNGINFYENNKNNNNYIINCFNFNDRIFWNIQTKQKSNV